MGTLISLIFAIVPHDIVLRESVSSIEVNSFYDDNGSLVFVQNIFREPENVQAWRLVKDQSQLPQRDWSTDDYSVLWFDGDRLREVRTCSVVPSWTQYDRELDERERLPKERRKELRTVKAGLPALGGRR